MNQQLVKLQFNFAVNLHKFCHIALTEQIMSSQIEHYAVQKRVLRAILNDTVTSRKLKNQEQNLRHKYVNKLQPLQSFSIETGSW